MSRIKQIGTDFGGYNLIPYEIIRCDECGLESRLGAAEASNWLLGSYTDICNLCTKPSFASNKKAARQKKMKKIAAKQRAKVKPAKSKPPRYDDVYAQGTELLNKNTVYGFAKGHDPRSKEIFDFIAKLDYETNNDYFGFKSGGDGDNGEFLMDYLDCFFEKNTIKCGGTDNSGCNCECGYHKLQ